VTNYQLLNIFFFVSIFDWYIAQVWRTHRSISPSLLLFLSLIVILRFFRYFRKFSLFLVAQSFTPFLLILFIFNNILMRFTLFRTSSLTLYIITHLFYLILLLFLNWMWFFLKSNILFLLSFYYSYYHDYYIIIMVVPVTSVDMSTHVLLVQHTSHVYAQVFIAKRSSLYIFLFLSCIHFLPGTLFLFENSDSVSKPERLSNEQRSGIALSSPNLEQLWNVCTFVYLFNWNLWTSLFFAFLSAVHYAQHPIKQKNGTRTRFESFLSPWWWHILFPCVKPIFN